ncbi:hypothetical protein FEM48_Zijuj05G0170300 [Ziziphus jujuba var. spinosa]|uniref:Uncharacterized protein n=1 Tax=Ziziphus jujuba var. spinosa TaxID=714518 RepID=A0A978VG15_ZIZJJ|nr:hypothetical protein FEM48_Zijuj05G0170300 [Ziziphus jujuba var. spinosa]
MELTGPAGLVNSNGNLLQTFGSNDGSNRLRLEVCGCAAISRTVQVLELATDSELFELENVLFGPRGWHLEAIIEKCLVKNTELLQADWNLLSQRKVRGGVVNRVYQFAGLVLQKKTEGESVIEGPFYLFIFILLFPHGVDPMLD